MQLGGRSFRQVTLVDFEFLALPGERPHPICLVPRDLETGRTTRLWGGELHRRRRAPSPTQRHALPVSYYASAEFTCHLALGWPTPMLVLDLFTEFRTLTNGKPTIAGNSFPGALLHFGLDGMSAAEKAGRRALAMRGGPWSASERAALLDSCEADVLALEKL